MEEIDKYPLHKAVFDNDLKTLSRLLRKHDVAAKDKHGKLFHSSFFNILCAFDSSVEIKSFPKCAAVG